MADFHYNISHGRGIELCNRVLNNDPTAAIIGIVRISTTTDDATLKDYDTLAAVLGDAGTSEVGYDPELPNRPLLTDTGEGLTVTVDDVNDRIDADCDDQTIVGDPELGGWTSTDVIFCYAAAPTDEDSLWVPITQHDMVLNATDGSPTVLLEIDNFLRSA